MCNNYLIAKETNKCNTYTYLFLNSHILINDFKKIKHKKHQIYLMLKNNKICCIF